MKFDPHEIRELSSFGEEKSDWYAVFTLIDNETVNKF